MKKYTFEKSVLIKTEIGKLFQFHADTNNLALISPPGIKTEIELMSHTPLRRNSTVVLLLSKFGLKLRWKIRIAEYSFPGIIADSQEKGLFKYWLHYHIFENENGAVRMTDRIEFIPPFGILGLAAVPVMKFQLDKMFAYRHSKTKEIFERD